MRFTGLASPHPPRPDTACHDGPTTRHTAHYGSRSVVRLQEARFALRFVSFGFSSDVENDVFVRSPLDDALIHRFRVDASFTQPHGGFP